VRRLWTSVACVLFGLAGCSYAQTVFSGNIQGVVTDPSGASVAGATVALRNVDTGVEVTATTSASGNYRFSSLAPGRYTVRVESAGFSVAEERVTLETNQTQGINIRLSLASSKQTVSVVS